MFVAFNFQELLDKLGQNTSPIVIVIGVLALCFAFFRMNAKRLRQAAARGESRPAVPHAASPEATGSRQPMRGDAEQLLVELQELGREIEGRIDTRIQYLTRLLAEADRTIERMSSAVAAAREQPAGGEQPAAGDDSRRAKVLALARDGADAAEIARRLELPKGEVELMIGLARRGAEEKSPPQNA